MSESTNNPLNDFLNGAEEENDLFADFPFPVSEETADERPAEEKNPTQEAAGTESAQEGNSVADNPEFEEIKPEEPESSQVVQRPDQKQASLFETALAQTPAAPQQAPQTQEEDPFTAALKKAKAKSDERLTASIAEKAAIFSYGKAKDPIDDRECTFEDLRLKYETDFPELSESKKVSWSVAYGKVTKTISNPGSDKVYDVKAEIEKSKAFLDGVKKAKTDAEKQPECLVKPRVTAQSKGETVRMPSYKECCLTAADAQASDKPIIILPARDGKIYEMRKTPIGTFTAPADFLPELPEAHGGFEMALPKIPMHILMFIINFFQKLSDRFELEALVHILYDTVRRKYAIRVPRQELTHVSVRSVMEEEYPEHMIHVMDIHSHNTMPAKFSPVDDDDEKATRLYAVVGRLDKVFPDITVRASCAGKFICLKPQDVFETSFKAYPYPSIWDEKIDLLSVRACPELPESCTPPERRENRE